MADILPIGTILAVAIKQVIKTAHAAKDVVIEKDSFRTLSAHLFDIARVLQELELGELNESPIARKALENLETDVKKANSLVEEYKNRSRFYLLVKCRHILKEVQDVTRDIGRSLNTLCLANTEILSGMSDEVARLQDEMQRAEFALVKNPRRGFCFINKTYKDTQIQLGKVASATNNFSDENIIREGGFGKDYRGQMLQSGQLIDITAQRLNPNHGRGDVEFWKEISTLYSLKHKNVASIIGFCDEKDEKIIIYEHSVHGTLDQHLSNPNLTWFLRLQICLGVARALSHVHYDIIHCDIKSSKIFLDKDWEPKIFGFQLCTNYPQSWRHRLLFSHYFNTNNMTPKHDVYSFGMLLFEVLSVRKPVIRDDGAKEELDEIMDPNLRNQMDTDSLSVFIKVAYNCLNQQLVQRPTMDHIVKELEEAFEHQWKHENLEHSTDEGASSNNLKMEWLKIPLSEIRLATNNFDEAYCVGYGGFGIVYKAKLDVLDMQSLSSFEGKSKDELPKISKIVAIKRIFARLDEQGIQGFLTEIELLTTCKHPNIVSLLGFSKEAREMILVYEYAFKGSLNDYLGSTGKTINLNWAQRLHICLDIAQGINYLHTNMEGKPRIIHRDIKSENILLDENLNAKVADFGLSKFHPTNQQASTIHTKNIAGTEVYIDPEYLSSFKYKKESDIYSFGVVLFEILSGRLAYDSVFMVENDKGLAPIVRRRFNEGTLKELIDLNIIEEDDENTVTLNRGPNQYSFEAFSRIAYQCLAETQAKRPTMEAVIKELQNALYLQGETIVLLKFQLSDIVLATQNFSESYCIGLHAHGMVYKAELDDFDYKSLLAFKEKNNSEIANAHTTITIKRISSKERGQAKEWFLSEIEMYTRYNHPNILSPLGFCDEGDEMILVYKHLSNKSLDDYLRKVDKQNNLTWTQRLNMCLELAHGLHHLHTKMKCHHGDIRSANIMLGKNWESKITYFGISTCPPSNHEASTKVYIDPEYVKTSKYKKENDIYSFGVVLFEILSGRLAYDPIYIVQNDKGLAPIARQCFNDGTINKVIDPRLIKEASKDIFISNTAPKQDSLDTFSKIAYQCLGETQAERPTMKIIISKLEIALNLQGNIMESLQISLKEIELATESFSQKNCIETGRYWKTYKGEIEDTNAKANGNGRTTIVAKRWDSNFGQGGDQFLTKVDILIKCKHENIIGLVGYCNEMNEKIIVYEHVSNESLDKHLRDASLTWMKRLKICIGVASALNFLHGGSGGLNKLVGVHQDIKSSSILLNNDGKPKISNLELSPESLHHEHADDNAYLDPEYKHGFLTENSDMYSLGIVLFEILCGGLASVEDKSQSLGLMVKHYIAQGKLDDMVFEGIKKQIVSQSLTTFADIASKCLHDDGYERPEASEVVIHLKKALEFQEDSEIWEPKLPRDYKEIIRLSKTSEMHSEKKKDIYKKLSDGVILQKDKVWLLSENGITNKRISATTFTYDNYGSHKWRSIHKSRFRTVAKMLDISNLNIKTTMDTQFLTPGVIYGAHLVFKFCDPRKYSSKPMYVNLKYRNRNETLHSYFATWRDDGWMMVELCRFLHHKEDIDHVVLLESFSRYYCRTSAIYIQGIEFRAINDVSHEDIKNQKEVENSNSNMPTKRSENDEKMFWLREVNRKKHLVLSAKEVLHNSPPLRWKPSADSSKFEDVMELLPQQVFRIKYKVEGQMLSPFTEYACYLVFKLSKKCRGLHCPVKVRDLLDRKNEETKIIYFRSPAPLNEHDGFWVPKQRKDGWMEVMVWKLKSKSNKHGNNFVSLNLKLITYEGTMSGLIIYGLEFRPM